MHWVELALQGVRGFLPSVRVSLRPGYWTLLPTAPGTPLVELALALLYPDGRGGDLSLAAPGQSGAKAALWFTARDGSTYRVMRELGRSGALHRVNPTTRAHDLVSEDPSETVQFLRGQVGLPARTVYEQLFTFTAAQLPSRRLPKRPRAAGGAPVPMPIQATPVPDLDPAAAAARIAELEQERGVAGEVEQLQYRLDGLASQIFQLEGQLKRADALESGVAEARAAFDAAPTPRTLGLEDDIIAQARSYGAQVAKCDDALARLEQERQLDAATAPPDAVPITRDGRFWVGIALGTAALLGAGFSTGAWRYVALLDIPAFGLAALVALKHVEDVQWSEYAVRKGERLAEREKKIRDQFEEDTAPLRSAMKALGVEKPDEVVAALAQREELWNRVLELEGHLNQIKESPEYVAASTQLAELRSEQEKLHARLVERGSYVRETSVVERELSLLREAALRARAPAPPPPSASRTPAPAEPLEDPIPGVLRPAADLLALDLPAVAALVRDRWTQYVVALTEKRVDQLEVDSSGRTHARVEGRRVGVGELAPRDLDFVYLALRLTVVEKASARAPLAVLLEELTPALDEARLPLLGRMLKHLGSLTQVLHATNHAVFSSASDGSANV